MHPKILATEAANIFGVTVQAIHKQLKAKKLPLKAILYITTRQRQLMN